MTTKLKPRARVAIGDVSAAILPNRFASAKRDRSVTPRQTNEDSDRYKAAIHASMSAQDEELIEKIVEEDHELLRELANR